MNQITIVRYLSIFLSVFLLIPTGTPLFYVQGFVTDAKTLSLEYSFDEPMLDKVNREGNEYTRVSINGSPCGGNPGEPNLPSKGAYILIPQGKKVQQVTINTGKKTILGNQYIIEPVGMPTSFSQKNSIPSYTPNETSVLPTTPHPENTTGASSIQWFRGYQILVLTLHPMEYIPLTGELLFYKEITVTVTLTADHTTPMLFRGLPEDRREVINKVDNPDVIQTYQTEKQPTSTNEYDLLIITTEEFKNDFQRLQQFHEDRGIRTKIALLGVDIAVSYSYRNTCLYIRNYIRDTYQLLGINYVLIGGDDDIIPDQDLFSYNPGGIFDHVPSDLYYACLDGTYNYDGDDWWGEPTDGENGGDVDLIAEVYVGRAGIGDHREVNHFINKTITYVQNRDNYLKKVVMVGEYLGGGDYGGDSLDELIDGCTNHGYTTVGIPSNIYNISTLYDRDWPGHNWPKEEIINRMNSGVQIINHLGHSNIITTMKMDITDVDNLANTNLCFIYSQGCDAGAFDNPNIPERDCIAEHLTIKTDNAAFAGIWNSRWGWGIAGSTDGPSQRYNREFWDAVFGENISVISKANQDSKEDNLYRVNDDYGAMRLCYYQLNYFGDPTLSFRSPQEIKINDVKGSILGSVRVTIMNVGIENVTNVEWNISVKGGVLGFINVFATGTIDLLQMNETKIVEMNQRIFGFGPITITSSAFSQNVRKVTKTTHGLIVGLLVLPLEE